MSRYRWRHIRRCYSEAKSGYSGYGDKANMVARILIIGGYGNFGSYIARSLVADDAIGLLIGGRSLGKAQVSAASLDAPHPATGHVIDIDARVR